MPRPSASSVVRLFVASYPPVETAARLLSELKALNLPPHRPVPQEQMHLTIQFIGNVAHGRLEETAESVQRAAKGIERFRLTALRLITLPRAGDREPPRLVAAETDAPPPLLELHQRLVRRFARKTRRDAADRFTPHLTLCRFDRETATSDGKAAATPSGHDAFDEVPLIGYAPFEVSHISLMRSDLRPGGAIHREVAAIGLGDPD